MPGWFAVSTTQTRPRGGMAITRPVVATPAGRHQRHLHLGAAEGKDMRMATELTSPDPTAGGDTESAPATGQKNGDTRWITHGKRNLYTSD